MSLCVLQTNHTDFPSLARFLSLTLKQKLLLAIGVQPDAQLRAGVVGGTVVTCAPSAGFLQIYFSLLLQLTTSHSPANRPVVMATHPCLLSFMEKTAGEKGQLVQSLYCVWCVYGVCMVCDRLLT